jgi:hypothetical protein
MSKECIRAFPSAMNNQLGLLFLVSYSHIFIRHQIKHEIQ